MLSTSCLALRPLACTHNYYTLSVHLLQSARSDVALFLGVEEGEEKECLVHTVCLLCYNQLEVMLLRFLGG